VGFADVRRNTRGGGACSTSDTGLRRIVSSWVVTVKPEHIDTSIIPNTHDKSHSITERFGHLLHAASGSKSVGLYELSAFSSAEVISNRAELFSVEGGCGVLNELTVLHPFSLDLNDIGVVGSVSSNELSDHGDGLGAVNGEVRARSPESFVSISVRSKVTSTFITGSVTLFAFASQLTVEIASMRSESLRNRVGFPDVHLSTARAVFALASFGVPAVGV
jgi:hypothetical protein